MLLQAPTKRDPGAKLPPLWEWPIPRDADVSRVPARSIHPIAQQRPTDPYAYLDYYKGSVGYLEQHYYKSYELNLIVLQEIEQVPGIWIKKKFAPPVAEWAKVGARVYERTGEMVAIATMRQIWSSRRRTLRARLMKQFATRKPTPEEVEQQMWAYGADYAVIRFYRRHLADLEKELREKGLYRTVIRDGRKVREVNVFTIDSDDEDGVEAEFQRIQEPQELEPLARAEIEAAREQELMRKAGTISRRAQRTPRKRKSGEDLIREQPVEQEVRRQRLEEEQHQRQIQAPQNLPAHLQNFTPAQEQELNRKIHQARSGVRGITFSHVEQAVLQYRERMFMMQQQQAQQQQMLAFQRAPPPQQAPPERRAPSVHQPQIELCNALIRNFINDHPDRVVLMTSVLQNTLNLLREPLPQDTEQTEVFQILSERFPNYIQRFK